MKERKIPNILHAVKMVVFSSFVGFIVENAFKLVRNGYVDNRFMFLPFLLGYGLFTVAIGIFIGTPKNLLPLSKRRINIKTPLNYFVYFLIAALFVSLGELALGYAVEWVGGFYYWDYTNLPLNFTRYTSLPTSVGFGVIITLFMGFVYEPAMRLFERKMSSKGWRIATIVAAALLVADFIASFAVMLSTGKRMLLWRWHIFKK